jgi:hypothetical protein
MEAISPGWYPDPSHRHAGRYWNGTDWTVAVIDDGVQGVDPSLDPDAGPSAEAVVDAEPHPPASAADVTPMRRRRRALIAAGVVVIALLSVFVLARAIGSGSGAPSLEANAASACSDATTAANQYSAGTRRAASAERALGEAERSLRVAARRYVAYETILQNIHALGHDIKAGVPTPSPTDLASLNTLCGPVGRDQRSAGTRTGG